MRPLPRKVSPWPRSSGGPSTPTSATARTRPQRWTRHSVPTGRQQSPPATNGTVADVLVDTDVFVDHLRGAARLVPGRHRLHYSVVTRAELFAGTVATDLVTRLLAPLREVVVDRAIAERAGRLRRESGIRSPDALIAATALEHRLSLATRSRQDFDRVRGLRLRTLG